MTARRWSGEHGRILVLVRSPYGVRRLLDLVDPDGSADRIPGDANPEADSGARGIASKRGDDLLCRVGAGDKLAFDALYDEFASAVFKLVLRMVRSRDLAEETTLAVFVEMWREAPRFDPEKGSALGWILTAAHRRVVESVRGDAGASQCGSHMAG